MVYVTEWAYDQACKALWKWQTRAAKIQDALERYGAHDYDCKFYGTTTRLCSCGFDEALTIIRSGDQDS